MPSQPQAPPVPIPAPLPHLAHVARDLQRHGAVGAVHGVGAEDVGDLGDLGAGWARGRVHLRGGAWAWGMGGGAKGAGRGGPGRGKPGQSVREERQAWASCVSLPLPLPPSRQQGAARHSPPHPTTPIHDAPALPRHRLPSQP